MKNMIRKPLLGAAIGWLATTAWAVAEATDPLPPNRFVEVAQSDVGGHFFSQVIYAPPVEGLVSWGTNMPRAASGKTAARCGVSWAVPVNPTPGAGNRSTSSARTVRINASS